MNIYTIRYWSEGERNIELRQGLFGISMQGTEGTGYLWGDDEERCIEFAENRAFERGLQ